MKAFILILALLIGGSAMARDGDYYPPPAYSPAPEIGEGDTDEFNRSAIGQSAKKLLELIRKGDYEAAQRHYEMDKERFGIRPSGEDEPPIRRPKNPSDEPMPGTPGLAPSRLLR